MTQTFANTSVLEAVLYYLKHCPEEDYQRVMNEVTTFWSHFAVREEKQALDSLKERIKEAHKKTAEQPHSIKANAKDELDH